MNNSDNSFIGTGWSFPPTFNRRNYSVEMTSMDLNIKQSLIILLSTIPGERILVPEYGCDLTPMLFENLDTTLLNTMKQVITKAILLYEPRIDIERIDIAPDTSVDGLVKIVIWDKKNMNGL